LVKYYKFVQLKQEVQQTPLLILPLLQTRESLSEVSGEAEKNSHLWHWKSCCQSFHWTILTIFGRNIVADDAFVYDSLNLHVCTGW